VIPLEFLMLENALIELVSDFVEIVHVELPHEWWKVPVPKVDGQNLLLKFLYVLDDEVGTLIVPW